MPNGGDTHATAGGTFRLGSWSVNRVGYGAMQLAGDNVFGPPRDRDEAVRVLRAAIELGINHIDTAQYYGPGVVNELIREALHPYPDNLAIVSKVAARRDDRGAVQSYDKPHELRAGIEENLATLAVDRLAAVNLRVINPAAPSSHFDAQLNALVHARDEGLIDGIGLSNISLAQLQRARDLAEIVCVQNLFNLADQRSFSILAECTARGIAFVPFCPLGWPRGIQNAILNSAALAQLAARLGATPAQVALAWLLDIAPNILLIPGTRTRSHLAENIDAAVVELDASARLTLAQAFPGPATAGAR